MQSDNKHLYAHVWEWLKLTAVISFIIIMLGLGAMRIWDNNRVPQPVSGDSGRQWRPRPFRPDPPAPLSDNDERLFERLVPRFRQVIAQKVAEDLEAQLAVAIEEIRKNPDTVVGFDEALDIYDAQGDQVRSGVGLLLGSAITGFIVKAIKAIVMSVVAAAIIALAVKFWPILVPAFMIVVSIIAWPAGWAAGKLGKSKE